MFGSREEELVKQCRWACRTMMYHHHCIVVVISFFLGLYAVSSAIAEENKTLITAGPSWERLTNKDGHGLYHDIIKQVFAGYEVKHFYVSTVQANSMVTIGRADIKMCETKEIDSLVLSSTPMFEDDFYALYLRKRVDSSEGKFSLEGKKVVWRQGYYSKLDFSVPVNFIEVRSDASALKMVVHGRADFYIDDLNLIKKSFDNAGEKFDPEKFGLERVGTRKYFPVFANTPRGDALRKHYEKEMARLFKEGKLQRIYALWNFRMPKFMFSESRN